MSICVHIFFYRHTISIFAVSFISIGSSLYMHLVIVILTLEALPGRISI